MKRTCIATFLVLALTLTAAAQKRPPASHHVVDSSEQAEVKTPTTPPVPPALCNPCLFYGGDINISSTAAAGLSDENTLLISGSSTYSAFNVPSGATATVTGIFINVQADANFDPKTASYDIRTGVSEGNGGTSLASGSGNTAVQATGRNFIGLNEYTVRVLLSSPLVLTAGEYWVNLTPNCTNGTTDGSCNQGRFFVSNTNQNTNGFNASQQPNGSAFFNSPFFGFSWSNWCDSTLGLSPAQCRAVSYGLTGTYTKP